MNMFASAKTMTRGDLRKAFDDYAEAHGQELATLALERSTGARDVSTVPEARFINAMVELVCCHSSPGRMTRKSESVISKAANVHAALAVIREQAFARRKISAPG